MYKYGTSGEQKVSLHRYAEQSADLSLQLSVELREQGCIPLSPLLQHWKRDNKNGAGVSTSGGLLTVNTARPKWCSFLCLFVLLCLDQYMAINGVTQTTNKTY